MLRHARSHPRAPALVAEGSAWDKSRWKKPVSSERSRDPKNAAGNGIATASPPTVSSIARACRSLPEGTGAQCL